MIARLHTDEATARRLADIIAESLDAEGMAVSAYEAPTSWILEVHFAAAREQKLIRGLVAREAGPRATKESATKHPGSR